MIVSEDVYRELCLSAGDIRLEKAKAIVQEGRLKIKKVMYENTENFSVRAEVRENQDVYSTYIEIKNGEIENVECECMDYKKNYGTCKHIAATLIAFSKNEEYINLFDKEKSESMEKKEEKSSKFVEASNTNKESYRIFNQMIRKFYYDDKFGKLEEENEKKVRIIPVLKYSAYRGILEVEFKIGKSQMYKLRDLAAFYRKIRDREHYRYRNKT